MYDPYDHRAPQPIRTLKYITFRCEKKTLRRYMAGTLTSNLKLILKDNDILSHDIHAKIQVSMFVSLARIVRRTDTHTQRQFQTITPYAEVNQMKNEVK